MVLGSSPVAVTSPSDFVPASSKEFLDIQATIECGFTLKRVRDMTRTYSQLIFEHYANIGNQVKFINTIQYYQQSLSCLASSVNETKRKYIKNPFKILQEKHKYFSLVFDFLIDAVKNWVLTIFKTIEKYFQIAPRKSWKKRPYNPRKCTSTSSLSGCFPRFLSKAIISLPTFAEHVSFFEKLLSVVSLALTLDLLLIPAFCFQKAKLEKISS